MRNDDRFDFKASLNSLRASVEAASPWTRSGNAWYRLEFSDVPSNQVISAVAVVEGLARAIAAQSLAGRLRDRDMAYRRLRRRGALDLLRQVAHDLKTQPQILYGNEALAEFKWAVAFRDLLVHEGAVLSDVRIGARLIAAAESVLVTLRKIGRSRGPRAYGLPRRRH